MEQIPHQPGQRLKLTATNVAWVVLLVACVVAYLPGLSGPFVLDDFVSLAALGKSGGVTDWATFKAFVLGGSSGPTGRPLALVTFLFDANNWPTDPWPFKRTNLLIHLINGALLGALTLRILLLSKCDERNARWIALVSTACWLLHPFLVSTTLYAVQRMAQLSTLFAIAGLLVHLHYRSRLGANTRRAYLGMTLSIVVFTLLATLAKENGILLPLLIGVVEVTVVASQGTRLATLNRYWACLFLAAPALVVALYLGEKALGDRFFETIWGRDFSLYERFITQPRILADYLQHWFIPELYTTGVFQDHFQKSTGLFSPLTTLLSAVMHLAVISFALMQRRRWPLFALAALFFYVSHVLESSTLNLELYFEHRNYLATVFLLLPVVVWLQKVASRPVFFTATLAALVVLAGFTRYSATVWADFSTMVEASAAKAPTSARAQAQYSTTLWAEGREDEALQVIETAIRNSHSDRPLLLLNRLLMLCTRGTLAGEDFLQVSRVLSRGYYDVRSINLYQDLTLLVAERKCPDVLMVDVRTMFQNLLQVPQNSGPESRSYSQLQFFVGLSSVHLDEPALAVAAFEKSLQSGSGVQPALIMGAHLASSGYYDEALYLSELAELHLRMQDQAMGESDIAMFRANVRKEMEAAQRGQQSSRPSE